MLKTSSLILFILLIGCSQKQSTFSIQEEQTTKAQVLNAFEKLVSASKNSDLEQYFSLIDKNKFSGLRANGTNWNSFKELESDVSLGFQSIKEVHQLEFPNVTVTVIDKDTAILVNQYKQTFSLHDGTTLTSQGGGTQVWSKATGNWLIVSISASLHP